MLYWSDHRLTVLICRTIEQNVRSFILSELEIFCFPNFPLCHVVVIKAVPNHRVLLQVPSIANIVTSIWLSSHVNNKGVELVLDIKITLRQNILQIQNKLKV